MHGTGAEIRPDTVTGASWNRWCFHPLISVLKRTQKAKKQQNKDFEKVKNHAQMRDFSLF